MIKAKNSRPVLDAFPKSKNSRELIGAAYRKLTTALIKYPEHLEIQVVQNHHDVVVVKTRAHSDDHGKIIGANQTMFKALYVLTGLIGLNNGCMVQLERLQTPVVGSREFATPFRPAATWDNAEVFGIFSDTLKLILREPYEARFADVEDDANDKTNFFLRISGKEVLPLMPSEFIRTLSIVFHAIGKAKGRYIYVLDDALNSLPTEA